VRYAWPARCRCPAATTRWPRSSLNTHSSEFAAGWRAHSVEGFASGRRAFLTPAGQLTFEHHRLAPADLKDIHLVIYTPADDDTPQRLAQLQDKSSDAAAEAP
jgi:hypothetical protein